MTHSSAEYKPWGMLNWVAVTRLLEGLTGCGPLTQEQQGSLWDDAATSKLSAMIWCRRSLHALATGAMTMDEWKQPGFWHWIGEGSDRQVDQWTFADDPTVYRGGTRT